MSDVGFAYYISNPFHGQEVSYLTHLSLRRSAPKVLDIEGFPTQKVLIALVSSTIIDPVLRDLPLKLSL